MKKFGFTLAECIIALGIVGVIAAMTIPSLTANTSDAQIGPKLAKAVSTFEQANIAMLNVLGTDAITDAVGNDIDAYWSNLSNHLKGTSYNGDYIAKDGTTYCTGTWEFPVNPIEPPHRQYLGRVWMDINGGEVAPNREGIDRFTFAIYNDGSLRPKGGTNWDNTANSLPNGNEHWTTKCPIASTLPEDWEEAGYCTGHIFENNFKVFYE